MNIKDLPAVKLNQQLNGIDELLAVWFPRAKALDRFAVDKVIKLWERQARLLGMDAPQKIEVKDGLDEMNLDQIMEEANRRGIPVHNHEN